VYGQLVSILTRFEDRMQLPLELWTPNIIFRFQPSSGLSTGCNVNPALWQPTRVTSFNPHPVFRPDATRYFHVEQQGRLVSTLIRSFDRMQLYLHVKPIQGALVSTLIRSFDRMQLLFGDFSGYYFVFQPSSGLSTGCNDPLDDGNACAFPFQPSSGLSTGCNQGRPSSRSRHRRFQPSSGLSTGCNSGDH